MDALLRDAEREGFGMSKRGWMQAVCAAVLACATMGLAAQATVRTMPVPLPPMGWSSWNSFSNTVDARVVMSQARAMIASGLHKAGYQYINIDEGWWLGQRDAQGNIVVDPHAWPALAPGERAGDMANIVRFIHSQGLKAGIYTDAGRDGCGTSYPDIGPGYPNEGSEGHYEQDFLQFARWGFDYVKVDWCGGNKENLDPAVQYAEIARAIAHAEAVTGHRLFFSLCEWGNQSPWTWAAHIGGVPADVWRTSGDIVDPIVAGTRNAARRASFKNVLRNFDHGIHPEAEHTGAYNDPDMMVVGMPGLTDAQNRAHMALWAMSGAPLLVGADLTRLSPATVATLTNPGVVAVDQDALGLQAALAAEPAPGLQVWSKPLAGGGRRAVLLLNRSTAAASIAVRWSELGLSDAADVQVDDAWSGRSLGHFAGSYAATVGAEDAVLLLVRGREAGFAHYTPSGTGGAPVKAHAVRFAGVAARGRVARVQIVYRNPGASLRMMELRVNGQDATRVAFPPTGSTAGAVWIEANLDQPGARNVLDFSAADGAGPTIESIYVE